MTVSIKDVRGARIALGLSIRAFSSVCGLSVTALQNLEHGRPVRADTLAKVGIELGMRGAELVAFVASSDRSGWHREGGVLTAKIVAKNAIARARAAKKSNHTKAKKEQ